MAKNSFSNLLLLHQSNAPGLRRESAAHVHRRKPAPTCVRRNAKLQKGLSAGMCRHLHRTCCRYPTSYPKNTCSGSKSSSPCRSGSSRRRRNRVRLSHRASSRNHSGPFPAGCRPHTLRTCLSSQAGQSTCRRIQLPTDRWAHRRSRTCLCLARPSRRRCHICR